MLLWIVSLFGMQKYLPYSTDPNLSGALASVLWELNLLSSHYHPAISTLASGISSMSTANNQVLLSKSSPQQAYKEMSLDQELCFTQQSDSIKLNNKKRRANGPAISPSIGSTTVTNSFDDNELKRKLCSHFMVLHDIKENERLRKELDRTALSLQLYEQYKKQKKRSKPSRWSAIALWCVWPHRFQLCSYSSFPVEIILKCVPQTSSPHLSAWNMEERYFFNWSNAMQNELEAIILWKLDDPVLLFIALYKPMLV